MEDILQEIVRRKREIVEVEKDALGVAAIKEDLEKGTFRVTETFARRSGCLIAECKLQSPAKGRLTRSHSVTELARIYQQHGAEMISVHTDPHFLGSNEDLQAVRAAVDLPILRKDFIIDGYQIYQARRLGADAILLIVRILEQAQLDEFLEIEESLASDVAEQTRILAEAMEDGKGKMQ